MTEIENELMANYSYLFEADLILEIQELAIVKKFSENTVITEVEDYINSMPLLLSGAIKVLREDENGEEIVFYYLEKGDTCAMTLSCCTAEKKSEIRAIAETDVELMMLPKQKMVESGQTLLTFF